MIAYPQPATDKIYFIAEGLEYIIAGNHNNYLYIHSISGQVMAKIGVENNVFVYNTNDLSPGIYFYSGLINDVVYSGKFIIN